MTELVGGRYEVGEVIGRGGMAEVLHGTDVRLGRDSGTVINPRENPPADRLIDSIHPESLDREGDFRCAAPA